MLLLFAEELNTVMIAAIVGIITTIAGFIIAIFKNENLKKAIANRLIGGVRGANIITLEDLHRHDIIIKIKTVLSSGEHNAFGKIKNENRRSLFKRYLELVCNIYLESVDFILAQDVINYDEQDLKLMVIGQMAWRRKEISARIQAHLITINNDTNKAILVTDKLEEWRKYNCKLINGNVLNTISSGRFVSVPYKLDIILHQYSMGLDIIISNGADSFQKLNGELDSFLGE